MSIRIAIIGGTGLGAAIVEAMDPAGAESVTPETPFGAPSGPIVLGTVGAVPVALLDRHGAGHRFSPTRVPYQANIWSLRAVGCTHIVASGACGSLRETIHPGDLVLVDQILDRTVARPRSLFERAAVHVEFADPCCAVTRGWLAAAAERAGVTLHREGTYVCIEGPAFSTRAEAAMHRQLGCDVVGMTALPEARLAREAEMGYALLALPTDYDCWRPRATTDADSLLAEIRRNLSRAVESCITLVRAALNDVSPLEARPGVAAGMLDHAVWTAPEALGPDDARRLAWLRERRRG